MNLASRREVDAVSAEVRGSILLAVVWKCLCKNVLVLTLLSVEMQYGSTHIRAEKTELGLSDVKSSKLAEVRDELRLWDYLHISDFKLLLE